MDPANSAFSSLTLFDCTISNATMLVEAMTTKDLFSAWRISGQLQTKIVEVLDTRTTELSEVAEVHSKCTTISAVMNPTEQRMPTAHKHFLSDEYDANDDILSSKVARLDSADMKRNVHVAEDSSCGLALKCEEPPSGLFNKDNIWVGVKKEEYGEESEDECIILEEVLFVPVWCIGRVVSLVCLSFSAFEWLRT